MVRRKTKLAAALVLLLLMNGCTTGLFASKPDGPPDPEKILYAQKSVLAETYRAFTEAGNSGLLSVSDAENIGKSLGAVKVLLDTAGASIAAGDTTTADGQIAAARAALAEIRRRQVIERFLE